MILLLHPTFASAADLTGEAHATLMIPGDAALPPGAGAGGSVGVRPHELIDVALALDVLGHPDGIGGALGPRVVAWPLGRPARRGAAPFVDGGLGAALILDGSPGTAAVRQVSALGFGWALGAERATWQIGARWALSSTEMGLAVHVGAAFPPPRPPAPPPPPPPPAPPPSGPEIWFPHPWCSWILASEASILLGTVPAGTRVLLDDGVSPPEWRTAPDLAPIPVDDAASGSVIVAAWPGDVVTIEGVEVQLGDDAVAVVAAPSGVATVEVRGGGRLETHEVASADGYALWVRPARPTPLEVRFKVGSADVDRSARAAVEAFAEHAGGSWFVVQGGHSPEGDAAANQRLAMARAEAIAAALTAAGISADRLTLTTLATPKTDEDPASLRVVRVIPVPPGAAP
jgi:outer membrane protein OmpA-like peptidoglycan-associated protein